MIDAAGSRAPYLGFAACVGAAAGAVLYRFGVLPFAWESPYKLAFEVLPAGLLIGGWQLVRPLQPRRWPVALAIATCIAAAVAAFGAAYFAFPTGGRMPLATRDLPGFSIDLPSGDVAREQLDYPTGRLELTKLDGTRAAVALTWEPGASVAREDLAAIASALAKPMGNATPGPVTTIPGPGGTAVDTISLSAPDGTMLVSTVPCGNRHISVMTIAADDVDRLHGRIVASTACHPDPAREATVGTVPLALDLPPAWHSVPGEPGLAQLTDGRSALLVRANPGADLTDEDAPKALGAMFQAMGWQVTVHPRDGDRLPLDGTIDGEKVVGWAMVFPCTPNAVFVLGLAENAAAADDIAKLVRKAHCLRSGDAAKFPSP